MIPKIIHFCWFGYGKKTHLVRKCLRSWRKEMPDYEIIEWNESNFDINLFPYAREAYEKRKYAFVADVARLYALYNYGGIYFDTDIEIIKSLNPFLDNPAFVGFESIKYLQTGLIACEKGNPWITDFLSYYKNQHFILEDGSLNMTTNAKIITERMLSLGLRQDNTLQKFAGLVTVYPKEYFSPKIYESCEVVLTNNTYAIHHFAGSWMTPWTKITRWFHTRLGDKLYSTVVRVKNNLLHF